MDTPYFIDYVSGVDSNNQFYSYFVLVRRKDDAYLYANESLTNVELHCWHCGIPSGAVSYA